MTFRRVLIAACVAIFLLATSLWIYLPIVPHSILGWVVLIVLGLPLSLLIQWMGEVMLEPAFFDRMSSPVRVLVTIPLALIFCAMALALVWGVRLAVSAA